MRIPGRKAAIQSYRWFSSRLSQRGIILGYHRIAQDINDVYDICVTPEHFSEHLAILKRDYHPINLASMAAKLLNGTLPHKSVAVTFDDGYADNLTAAKPLLQQFDIPATLFVCPAYLGREFWWDELERIIHESPSIPETLLLRVGDDHFKWNTNAPIQGSPAETNSSQRKHLLHVLYNRLSPLGQKDREDALIDLKGATGYVSEDHSSARALLPSEMREIAADGLIEIGAHTMTHPILPHIPAERQREEILQSKLRLEEILNCPVNGFAYPNGVFTEETKAIVKDTGFVYACSSERNVIYRRQDRYSLPRFWPKDWGGDRFAKDLRLWLG
jgi:peptidoglycan/xylan/chitin deacetylase (PgdA/CDA1 family)